MDLSDVSVQYTMTNQLQCVVINEKKHPPIHPFRLITLDRLAAYTVHIFLPFYRFCADAHCYRKYRQQQLYQKGQKNLLDHFPGVLHMEHLIDLLGI